MPSKRPPLISVTANGATIVSATNMAENSCHFWWPQRWYHTIDSEVSVDNGTKLIFAASYDSGGLFDSFDAKYSLDYDLKRHGEQQRKRIMEENRGLRGE